MIPKQSKISWCIAIPVFLYVTYYSLGYIASNPGTCLHELGGDALKNYYSYLQQSLHGNGWWFDGMNYPYGEHLMFVDGQPALTLLLANIRDIIHLTPYSATAILNLLMAFSVFLAMIFVYKLLLRFKVHYIWAIITACCIACASAQNARIFGLYGLSYACVTPMLFYWFVCYKDTSKLKYMLYIFILTTIAMFLHPYNMALVLVWCAFYILGCLIFQKLPSKNKLIHVLPVLSIMIFCLGIFKSIAIFTDPITDRTTYPHGLLSYRITFMDIISSKHSLFWDNIQDTGGLKDVVLRDSLPYIGLGPWFIIAATIIFLLYSVVKRGNSIQVLKNNYIWFFITLCALIYAMGVPFIWDMEWLYDYIASFRQFRSLDWFGLIFYYVFTTFAAVALYKAFQYFIKGKKYVLSVVMLLPLFLWIYESYGMVSKIRNRSFSGHYNYEFFHSLNSESWNEFMEIHNQRTNSYQAILMIPYFHVGSEKIWLTKSSWEMSLVTKAAFQLQLPVVDANMSRSSWSQTFKQVKIDGGPYTYKSLLHEVKDNRPYLLLTGKDQRSINPDEAYLFSVADSIGEGPDLIAYSLSPEKLRQADKAAKKRAKDIAHTMKPGDSSLLNRPYYYEHFEHFSTPSFFGRNAGHNIYDKDTLVASVDVSKWDKGNAYECSAWFLVNDKDFTSPDIEVKLFDSNWQLINTEYMSVSKSTDNQGLWFRASCFLTLPDNGSVLQLNLKKSKEHVYKAIDEVLIKHAADTIISIDNKGRILANNHMLL